MPTSLTYILRPDGKRLLNLGDLMRCLGTFMVCCVQRARPEIFTGRGVQLRVDKAVSTLSMR